MNPGDNSESLYINSISFNDLFRTIYLMLNTILTAYTIVLSNVDSPQYVHGPYFMFKKIYNELPAYPEN